MTNALKKGDFVKRHPDFLNTPRDINWGKDEFYLVEKVTNYNEIVIAGKVDYFRLNRFTRVESNEPVDLNDFL